MRINERIFFPRKNIIFQGNQNSAIQTNFTTNSAFHLLETEHLFEPFRQPKVNFIRNIVSEPRFEIRYLQWDAVSEATRME